LDTVRSKHTQFKINHQVGDNFVTTSLCDSPLSYDGGLSKPTQKTKFQREINMNEYKHLTNKEVNTLYKRAKASVKDLSPFMATNDRLYLQQQLVKLRNEVLRRLNK